MAIEIYDRAKAIKKDGRVYYFVKHGSKNCFTCPFQRVTGDNFENVFITRQRRESDWNLIAHGTLDDHREQKLAETKWNASTGSYYGQVRFGNRRNIALYLVKQKPIDYETLSDEQKFNVDRNLRYYLEGEGKDWCIDLGNIPENKRMKTIDTYCGHNVPMSRENSIQWNGRSYWALNNL